MELKYAEWPMLGLIQLTEDPTAIMHYSQDLYEKTVGNLRYKVLECRTKKFGTYRFCVPMHMWNRSVSEDVIVDKGEAIACSGCVYKDWFIDSIPKYDAFRNIDVASNYMPYHDRMVIDEVEEHGGVYVDYGSLAYYSFRIESKYGGDGYFISIDDCDVFNSMSKDNRMLVYKAINDIVDEDYVVEDNRKNGRCLGLPDILLYISKKKGNGIMNTDNLYSREDNIQVNSTEEERCGCIRYDFASDAYGLYTFLFPHTYWDLIDTDTKTQILATCRRLATYGNEQHNWTLEEVVRFMNDPTYTSYPNDVNGCDTSPEIDPTNPFVVAMVNGVKGSQTPAPIDPTEHITITQQDIVNAFTAMQMDKNGYIDYRNRDALMKAENSLSIARSIIVGNIQKRINGYIAKAGFDIPLANSDVPVAIRVVDQEPVVPINTDPSNTILLGHNSVPLANYQDFLNLKYSFDKNSGQCALKIDEAAALAANYIYARDKRLVDILNETGTLGDAANGYQDYNGEFSIEAVLSINNEEM